MSKSLEQLFERSCPRSKEYKDRIKKELEIIEAKNFTETYHQVHTIIQIIKRNNSLWLLRGRCIFVSCLSYGYT